MNGKIRKNLSVLLSIVLLLSIVITNVPTRALAVAQSSGGPIILMGIDAEDGGPGGHGPISVYQNIINSIRAKVTNGGSGILVFGANSQYVTDFWNAIGSGTGQKVQFVDEASIDTQGFTGYAMLAVSSDEHNTYGGLTQIQHNKLVVRQNDIASFINNGGGLIGFASDFTNPYAYLGAVGNISANINLGYSDVTPNAEGQAIGITDDLDICCWHDEYNTYPDFLSVLATSPSGNPAVIGGLDISVPSKLTATPSTVSIAQGQNLPLKITMDDGVTISEVSKASSGTKYSSSSENVLVNADGIISLQPAAQIGDTAVITVTHQTYTTTVNVKVDEPVNSVQLLQLNAGQEVLLGSGEKHQLSVSALYSDGARKDVTYASMGTTYESSDPASVLVSPNGMILVTDGAVSGEAVPIIVKNQDKTAVVNIKISEPPVSLLVTPETMQLKSGQSQQLTVSAIFADGSKKDVTKSASYLSGSTSLAIVSNSGLITIPKTARDGQVSINIKYAGISSATIIDVSSIREFTGIQISPEQITLKQGSSQGLKVIANYSDGTMEDVTSATAYKSGNESLAVVDHHGVVTIPSSSTGGTVTITGVYNNQTVSSKITVPALPVLNSLKITPSTVTLKRNETQQFQVIAEYSDGTSVDVTSQVAYQSSNESLAMVNSSGLATVAGDASGGSLYIRGSFGGKGTAATVTVPNPPIVTELKFTIDKQTLLTGEKAQVTVIAKYSDGTSEDVTANAGLTSSLPGQAFVDPATGQVTVLDSATGGTVYIRGSYGGKGGAASFTIPAAPTVSSLTFTPAAKTVKPGDSVQINVMANYTDGTSVDVTNQASLISSNATLASVDKTTGLVSIPATAPNGIVNIQGSFGGKGGSTSLTVSKPYIVGLSFNPDKATLKAGETIQIGVTAIYSDGSAQDVTSQTAFTTSNVNLATVNPAGLVTAVSPTTGGSLYIRGTFGGKGAASTITIDPPASVSNLKFTPSSASLKNGETLQLNVVAEYSDGTSEDVTSRVSFTSSNPSLATVDSAGLITVLSTATPGTVYIRGSFNGKGSSATITIPAKPTVQSLTFKPLSITLLKGSMYNVQVIANYSDGSNQDVTAFTLFSTSNANLATVDGNGLINVLPLSAGGTVYIRGSYGGKGGATTVTVPK
ncbi:Ig-like domain-containing protein [Cytobacillus oceanisediminis]|uniref:Ig-like domain-containing protein n=1 Tax=Cytobacillus oceanisediminis TaxID=665099 RepID=UPI0011A9779C|nr:Ig-like domain-containing protein [Cytobacillus oceanisediminis]